MIKTQMSCAAVVAILAGLSFGAGPASAEGFDQAALIEPATQIDLVFIPKVVHPWYDVVEQGAQYAIEELKKEGIEVTYNWDAPPVADVDQHNRRIEANIGKQPDGLAVSCLDPATNTQLLEEAVANGINLITFDTYCDPEFAFVGHRLDEQDGRTAADYLGEKLGGKGTVGILVGSLTATNHAARVKGFKEQMAAKYPDIEIVFELPDNDNLEQAVSMAESGLQATPDLGGIYGANASAPIGAARAVIAADRVGKTFVVGAGDIPETYQLIEDGAISAITAQRQWDIGYWSVRYLVAAAQNHTIPMDHATGGFLMTKENLGQ
jgi:ribose transport system substrate-binding protein